MSASRCLGDERPQHSCRREQAVRIRRFLQECRELSLCEPTLSRAPRQKIREPWSRKTILRHLVGAKTWPKGAVNPFRVSIRDHFRTSPFENDRCCHQTTFERLTNAFAAQRVGHPGGFANDQQSGT